METSDRSPSSACGSTRSCTSVDGGTLPSRHRRNSWPARAPEGSRKALQRQVLDAQTVVFVDQFGRELMEKVSSQVGNPTVNAGDPALGFGPAPAAVLAA